MATNWGNAEAAGAGADMLRQMLTDKILAAKVAEDNRRAQVDEAQRAQQLAQQAEAQRAAQAMQMTALTDNRDERYQNRLFDTRRMDADTQQHSMDQQMAARDKTEARTLHGSERAEDLKFRGDELKARTDEAEKGRALQRYLAGGREPPKAEVHWDKDVEGNPRAYRVGRNGEVTPVDLPGAAPAGPSKADTFRANLDTFSTNVYNHPGLSEAGAGFNIGRPYKAAFGNLKGASNQLVNLYLEDPEVKAKIAAMKPATKDDVQRALAAAVNIDIENMDAGAIKSEIDRMRTKAGLKPLGGAAPAADGGPQQVMTKPQRNKRTGQTRTLTSTDGGATWN